VSDYARNNCRFASAVVIGSLTGPVTTVGFVTIVVVRLDWWYIFNNLNLWIFHF
jgi:hypothetical protein